MNQVETSYLPTQEDKVNVCMAFLTYIGEKLEQDENTARTIFNEINAAIPKIPTLLNGSSVDWKIVWGPAIYTYSSATKQDSGMFVMQQISNPTNYVLAIRGTNAKALEDWIWDDFDVIAMKDWPGQDGAKISQATHNGIHLLLNKLIPDCGLPGEGQSIAEFLESISSRPITISFTGHSLGGALAPTLALLFKEQQDQWDSNCHAAIHCTAFAGATAGNAQFAEYSNSLFKDNPIRRIHDVNDVVPHAWNKHSMEQIATLYTEAGIDLSWGLKFILDVVIKATEDKYYTQIDNSLPITLRIDPSQGNSFFKQAGYQHDQSYPRVILGDAAGRNLLNLTK